MSDVSIVRGSYQPNQISDSGPPNPRESEAKHREEIREINEAHRAELEKMREENKKRIAEIREEENAKLSEKDVQHQKEIEALRAIYAKRNQGSTDG